MKNFPLRLFALRSSQFFRLNSSVSKLIPSRTIKFYYSQEINHNDNNSNNKDKIKNENKTIIDVQPQQMIELFQKLIPLRKQIDYENNQEKIVTILGQLASFIDNFNAHQLEYFLILSNEITTLDHELIDKLYEQTKQLLYSEQSDFNQSLRILGLLTESPLKEEQLEIFIKFLFTTLEMPYLEASTLALTIYVYGLIVKQYQIESTEFFQSITRHLRKIDQDYDEIMNNGKKDSQYINFTQQDLRQLSLGLYLGGSKTLDLQKYISLKVQSTFVDISNLIIISKYLLKQETINQEYLNYFKQQLEKSKDQLQIDDILQLAIVVKNMKQLDLDIQEFIIKEFLQKINKFTIGDKAFLYQKMAQMNCQSQDIWNQFALDVKQITENCEWFDACSMFYHIFDVFNFLQPECQEFIFNYIISQENNIDKEMKDLLFQKLQEKQIISEEDIEESKKLR